VKITAACEYIIDWKTPYACPLASVSGFSYCLCFILITLPNSIALQEAMLMYELSVCQHLVLFKNSRSYT